MGAEWLILHGNIILSLLVPALFALVGVFLLRIALRDE